MLETLFSIFSDLLITWAICRKMEWKNHVESCLNMTQMGIASHWLNMLQDHAAMLQISEKNCATRGRSSCGTSDPPWNHVQTRLWKEHLTGVTLAYSEL